MYTTIGRNFAMAGEDFANFQSNCYCWQDFIPEFFSPRLGTFVLQKYSVE